MSKPLLEERENGVAILTLNRPDRMNALDEALTDALTDSLQAIARDASVRAVVLTGDEKAFLAGGDIAMFARLIADTSRAQRADRTLRLVNTANALTATLIAVPQPTVAAVEGACVGIGLSLMMACDLAVAAENAVFALGYGGLGISPDGGASWLLPRLVGHRRAREIALLGERFGAAEAERWGLINRQCPAGEARSEAAGLAAIMARGAPQAQARTKRLLDQSWTTPLDGQLLAEADAFAASSATADFEEGIDAFLAKRPPRFTGE